MSRIGKKVITLNTAKIEDKEGMYLVTGPKGTLEVSKIRGLDVSVNEKEVTVNNTKSAKILNAKWGLLRSLLNNAVVGVESGYEKNLEMIGVGYRAQKSGSNLILNVGLSHQVTIEAPKGIEFTVEDNTKIKVSGFDKQLVGFMAAQIRKVRKPEPYKGKGIKYSDEHIRRKAGKSGTTA